MILPTQNKRFAEQYYNTLPSTDVNRKYYEEGLKYKSPITFLGKLQAIINMGSKLETLNNFYPHHRTVQASYEEYHNEWKERCTNNLLFTAASWFVIFNAARFGNVAPILREYGAIFRTHRLFRHYVWAFALPFAYSEYHMDSKYYDHIETLWTIHANRLNEKLLDDPAGSIYPREHTDKLRRTFI